MKTTRRISCQIPKVANVGQVADSIIKMIEKQFPEYSSSIAYFINNHWDKKNNYGEEE
jgi:hypothetical protein